MSKGILLFGAGGHASVCVEVLKDSGTIVDFCIDKSDSHRIGEKIHGSEIIPESKLNELYNEGYREIIIAIGDNKVRNESQRNLQSIGFEFVNAISPHAKISQSASVGFGVVIMPGVIINSNASIGNHAIVNSGSVIEHDCRIADFVHIGPNSTLTGNINIGTRTLIGAGSVLIPGISIGSDAVVGAGSVVIRDIPSQRTVYGNPATGK